MKMIVVKAVVHRAALLGLLWAVLTGAAPDAVPAGLLVVPAAVWLSLRLLPARHPLRLWRLALHLPRFLYGSVLGGIDVARRAFSPRMPLRPGWRAVPVDLPPGGRAALGAELSLMPGTLAAGVHDDRLLVHLLDTEAGFDAAILAETRALESMIDRAERP